MKKMIKLMPSQLGIYADSIGDPESTLYNSPFIGRIGVDIDTDALAAAVRTAIKAHPVLGARIGTDENGDTSFVINDEDGAELVVRTVTSGEFEQIRSGIVRTFALAKDKLSRFEIYKTPGGDWFFFDIHHLIIDGSTMYVITRDIADAYHGREIRTEEYDLADASAEEYVLRESAEFDKAREYFDALLGGCEPDCLPVRDVYSDTPKEAYFKRDFSIDNDLFKRLRDELHISKTAFFTSVFGFLIARYNYSSESVIGTVFSGRNEKKQGYRRRVDKNASVRHSA